MVSAFWGGGCASAGPWARQGPPPQLLVPVAVVAAGLASPALGSGSVWGKSSFNPSFHEYLVFYQFLFYARASRSFTVAYFSLLGVFRVCMRVMVYVLLKLY